jgi:hypothetical protein
MKRTKKFWSDEEIARLKKIYPEENTIDVARMLNRTVCSVNGMAHSLGLKKSNKFIADGKSGRINNGQRIGIKTQFVPGHVPLNKGKKWDEIMTKDAQKRARLTTFQNGRQPHNIKSDGTITIRTDNRGVSFEWIRIGLAKWIPLFHHVWIQEHGSVPKGHILAFKDRNPMNTKLENLMIMTKAENCKRNSIARIPLEVRQTMTALKKLKKIISEKETK